MGNKRGALEITDACLRLIRAEITSMEDSDEREDTEAVVALLRNAALWRREIEAKREGLRVDVTERADSLATTKDDTHDDDDDARTDARAREPIDLRALHL
jgi:hypothetical protein